MASEVFTDYEISIYGGRQPCARAGPRQRERGFRNSVIRQSKVSHDTLLESLNDAIISFLGVGLKSVIDVTSKKRLKALKWRHSKHIFPFQRCICLHYSPPD